MEIWVVLYLSLNGFSAPWGWGVAGLFPLPGEPEGRSLGSCQVISSLGLPLQASSHYGEDHKHLQTITPILPLLNLAFWSAAWQTEVQVIHLLLGAPYRPLFGNQRMLVPAELGRTGPLASKKRLQPQIQVPCQEWLREV